VKDLQRLRSVKMERQKRLAKTERKFYILLRRQNMMEWKYLSTISYRSTCFLFSFLLWSGENRKAVIWGYGIGDMGWAPA
jgi:hypothetical protein